MLEGDRYHRSMSSSVVDLRSDTVTQPTDAMRAAMADAVVGDDGYGEDPTVNALESRYAALVGKEAAVLIPSGVMANQIALRCHTRPGDTVVAGERQHIVLYEMGAAGRNCSVQIHGLDDESGSIDPSAVAEVIVGEAHHQPSISAIFLETPHMASGGKVLAPERFQAIADVVGSLPIHLDGARLFNAQVATGLSAAELARPATTVMSCLSKGLCAPVGSMLAGPSEVIAKARMERKRLGGSMRQAGVVAAPGLLALTTMVDRLADDHVAARQLAAAVARRWPDTASSLDDQITNLVVFSHHEPEALLAHLAAHGVLAGTIAPGVVRFVTHHDVSAEGIERAIAAIEMAP